MSFIYKIGQLVAIKSETLGDFYGKIIKTEPDGEFRNYLIVVTHTDGKIMVVGSQAWVDEIRIIGEATIKEAEVHEMMTK